MTPIADGVWRHESVFCQSNAVIVAGPTGVLLVDPGVHEDELICLADDLSAAGQSVVAGFSTHPHWDHLLWHARLGTAPRYGTAGCEATVHERLSGGIEKIAKAVGIPDEVPLELLGRVTSLAAGTTRIPWDGPTVRVVEHPAHAHGHAALLIEERGVLVAGDMLSDVLVPILDLTSADPVGDYLAGLDVIEGVTAGVTVVVPGHGSIAHADQVQARIDQDRAYVRSLRDARVPDDPRIGPAARDGWDWVAGLHDRQRQALAAR